MIGRKSFLIIIARMISAALAFVGLFFISRYLGPGIYGTISWTMALVATFNSVADLGFNAAHIKRVSEGKDINDCLSTFISTKLLLTGLMVTIVLSSVAIWTVALDNPLESSSIEIIVLFILFQVFMDLGQIATVTFDARTETAKTQLSTMMDPLIRVPLVIIVALNRMNAIELAYAYVLGGLAVAVVALMMLSRERFQFVKPTLFKSYLVFAIPIATITIINAFSINLDKIIIGTFWSNDFVGYYQASQSIMSLLAVIGTAVTTLAFPTFSRMHTEGNLAAVRKTTLEAERYIAMIAFPAVTLIVLFPTEVSIVLLGNDFASSGGPMRFLAVSMFFNLLNGVYASQINAVNRPDLTAKLTILGITVNVALLFALVPSSIMGVDMFGLAATGAAIANMLFFATLFLSTRYVVFRLTGTRANRRLAYQLAAAGVTGLALLGVSVFYPLSGWVNLLVYAGISLGVYSALLVIIGELRKGDLDYFLRVINPRDMKDYIVEELRSKKK